MAEQNVSQLMVISVATAVVNTANAAKEGKDIVTPIVASGVAFAGLSFVGQLWRWDIVNAIAGIFLLGAVINRGLPLISGAVTIATGSGDRTNTRRTVGGSF